MKISIDISYYPLSESYIPPIKGFIERIKSYEELIVQTNGISTQIFGDYDLVMMAVTKEIKKSFDLPHSIFVLKVINADLNQKKENG